MTLKMVHVEPNPMLHLKFLNLAMALVDKGQDGVLTLEEIVECVGDTFVDFAPQIFAEIEKALEDGEISIWETFRIVVRIVT